MISFRYHLITIVSIFLSIALGIVMGASFVQGALVERLTDQTNQAIENARTAAAARDRAQDQVDRMNDFAEEAFPRLAAGQLAEVPVVLLTQQGTAPGDLDTARAALDRAGAVLSDDLVLTGRLSAAQPEDARVLAEILDMSPSSLPQALRDSAARAIGRRLADGGLALEPEQDILRRLLDEGFMTTQTPPDDLARIGGLGSVLVVVAGGPDPPVMEIEDVLVPLLEAFSTDGRAVAAQSTDSSFPFVTFIRTDDELRGRVSTVDDVDLVPGQIALALAAADLAERGTVGHYGLEGDRAIPALPGAQG